MKKKAFFFIFTLALSLGIVAQSLAVTPIKIGAGSVGGSWFPMMTATMVVINEDVPGIVATVVPGSAISNARNINKKSFDIGLTYLSAAYEARKGLPPFKKKLMNLRAIGNYPSAPYQYAVRANSDIKSIKDLYNKKLSAGKRGSGTELAFSRLLEMYGLSYDSIRKNGGTVHFVAWAETKMLLKDRHIQMGIFDHRPPDPGIVETETAFPVRVLNIEPKVLEDYLKKYPGHLTAKILKGTYKGQQEDAMTLAWAPMLAAHKDVPENLVYNITKAIYENSKRLSKGFKGLSILSPKMAVVGIPIPFHPGAARYFKEKGILK